MSKKQTMRLSSIMIAILVIFAFGLMLTLTPIAPTLERAQAEKDEVYGEDSTLWEHDGDCYVRVWMDGTLYDWTTTTAQTIERTGNPINPTADPYNWTFAVYEFSDKTGEYSSSCNCYVATYDPTNQTYTKPLRDGNNLAYPTDPGHYVWVICFGDPSGEDSQPNDMAKVPFDIVGGGEPESTKLPATLSLTKLASSHYTFGDEITKADFYTDAKLVYTEGETQHEVALTEDNVEIEGDTANAGTFTVRYVGFDDYTLTVDDEEQPTYAVSDNAGVVEYTIDPKPVTIFSLSLVQDPFAADFSFVYDGYNQAETLSLAYENVDKENCEVTVTLNAGDDAVNAGAFTLFFTIEDTNYALIGVENVYSVQDGVGTKTFTILPANYDWTPVLTGYDGPYDGKGHGWTLDESMPETVTPTFTKMKYTEGENPVLVEDGEWTDQTRVGTYYVRVTFATTDTNYNAPTAIDGTMVISPKELTLDWSDGQHLTYNGAAQAPAVTISGFAPDTEDASQVSLAWSGLQSDASSDPYAVTITGLTGDLASEYVIKSGAKTEDNYYIDRKALGVYFSLSGADGLSAQYDGIEHTLIAVYTGYIGEAVEIAAADKTGTWSATDPNSYTATVKANAEIGTNYKLESDAECSWAITKLAATLSLTKLASSHYTFGDEITKADFYTDAKLVYTEGETQHEVALTEDNVEIEGNIANAGTFTVRYVGFGSYTLTVDDEEHPTYAVSENAGVVVYTIDPKPVTIFSLSLVQDPFAADFSFVYDGSDKTETLVDGGFAYKNVAGMNCAVTVTPNAEDDAVNAGAFTLFFTIADTNYTLIGVENVYSVQDGVGKKTFTIEPQELILSWRLSGYEYTKPVPYQGRDYQASASANIQGINPDVVGESSRANVKTTDDGIYTAQVVAKEYSADGEHFNYKVSPENAQRTFEWKIVPKKVTLRAVDKASVYGDDPVDFEVENANEIYDEDVYSVGCSEKLDFYTGAGTYDIIITLSENVTNYDITTENGSYTVMPLKVNVALVSYSGRYYEEIRALECTITRATEDARFGELLYGYDEEERLVNWFNGLTEIGAPECEVTKKSKIGIGSYPITFKLSDEKNYEIVDCTEDAYYEITPAYITDYTGKTQTNTLIYNGEEQAATISETATTVDESEAIFAYGNLVFATEEEYLVWKEDRENYEADQDAWLAAHEGQEIPAEITYDAMPKRVGAGNYYVCYRVSAENHAPVYGGFVFTVAPFKVAIEINSFREVYDGSVKALTYTLKDEAGNEITEFPTGYAFAQLGEITKEGSADVGTYAITFLPGDNANYEIISCTEDAKYVIVEADITDYEEQTQTNADTLIYSGGYLFATISERATTVNEQTATFTYGPARRYQEQPASDGSDQQQGEIVYGDMPALRDAGSYVIPFRITAPNHNAVTGEVIVEVAKKPITITANNQTSYYGEDPAEITLTGLDAIEQGDENVYVVTCGVTKATVYKEVGYPITVLAGENTNYEVTPVNGVYTVRKRPIKVIVGNPQSYYGDELADLYEGAEVLPNAEGLVEAIVNGDTGAYALACTVDNKSVAGKYNIGVSVKMSDRYEINFENTVEAYEVKARPIKVIVGNPHSYYGDELADLYEGVQVLPNAEGLIAAIVNEDDGNAEDPIFLFTCSADKTSVEGSFDIIAENCHEEKYAITFEHTEGAYALERRPITVVIRNAWSYYGDEAAVLQHSIFEGELVNGDSDVYTVHCTVNKESVVGKYSISGTNNQPTKYDINFTNEKNAYEVKARPIMVSVKKVYSVYGEDAVALEADVLPADGFSAAIVNGDENVYELRCSVSATSASGSYNVVGKNNLQNKYDVKFLNWENAYEVRAARLDLSLKIADTTYGTPFVVPTLANGGFTASGWVYEDDAKALTEDKIGIMYAALKPGQSFEDVAEEENAWSEKVPTLAGRYILGYFYNGVANYEGDYGFAEFTIHKADPRIEIAEDKLSKHYTGAELTFDGATSVATDGGEGALEYKDNKATKVGTYEMTVSYEETANFLAAECKITYVILEAEVKIEAPAEGESATPTLEKAIDPEDAKSEEGVSIKNAIVNILAAAEESGASASTLNLKVGGETMVSFDKAALEKLAENEDVIFLFTETKKEDIDTTDKAIQDAELVLEISLSGASFEGGKATITTSFKYDAPVGKVGKVFYVDKDGNKTDMGATFENGTVSFETAHFSTYVVEYVLSTGTIVGIILACVGAAGIALGVCFFLKKKKADKDEAEEEIAAEDSTEETEAEGAVEETAEEPATDETAPEEKPEE